jgi:hypothetical protein
MSISVGDRARSFDFDRSRDVSGERACYVEGEVVAFDHVEGCRRYRILVDRDVFGGEEESTRVGLFITPPVNGTPKSFGGTTNFVELV